MLSDSDARIRNEAATAILQFNTFQITQGSKHKYSDNHLQAEFVAETLSTEVPFLPDSSYGSSTGFQLSAFEGCDIPRMKRVLGKHLFDLTNMLFDLKSNEQLVRTFTNNLFQLN